MENAETVIQTNYVGTKNMTKAMIPLMRTSPSGAAQTHWWPKDKIKLEALKKNKITNVSLRQQLEDVDSLTEEVIDNVMKIFWESGMASRHISPEDAADTAVWLALLPDQFCDRTLAIAITINTAPAEKVALSK
ncbi:hypothetical protein RDI58_028777 [Solanum bulbocastanum]|uniref:Uncharacterized protein n=1 Tax=Solanum bulbocastanum TaxID=147425 RepID=A0AAN8SSI2_SOLBU